MQPRAFPLLLLLAVCLPLALTSESACMHRTQAYMDTFADVQRLEPASEPPMLYFMHAPRTAGRTFYNCFLRVGTPPSHRCPKAYDELRVGASMGRCRLLSSHDDYSALLQLPPGTAVTMHLREPVDRVISAYEFAIEVAARKMLAIRSANTGASGCSVTTPGMCAAGEAAESEKVLTEDVWPWSALLPFFFDDMRRRAASQRESSPKRAGGWVLVRHPDGDEFYHNPSLNQSKWTLSVEEQAHLLPPLDPYSNPLVMPLEEFVRHPIAQELLHNGQTFQVLGITNYSRWGDAGDMRACMWQSQGVRSQLLELAKGRIAKFIHVGSTNRLMDSVAAAAAALNLPLDGPSYTDEEPEPGPQSSEAVSAADALLDQARRAKQARVRLQQLQRRLFEAQQSGQPHTQEQALRAELDAARRDMQQTQELLGASRTHQPVHAVRTSLDEEAGLPLHDKRDVTDVRPGVTLGQQYQVCSQRAQYRSSQARQATLSRLNLPDGRFIRFDRAARASIPQRILQEIRDLNALDMELHELADQLLTQSMDAAVSAGKLHPLPKMSAVKRLGHSNAFGIAKPSGEAVTASQQHITEVDKQEL